jgi:hypothetical protein
MREFLCLMLGLFNRNKAYSIVIKAARKLSAKSSFDIAPTTDVADGRTCPMPTNFHPAVHLSTIKTLAAVPKCPTALFYKHKFGLRRFRQVINSLGRMKR